jgi:hypothetical protein
MMKHALVAATLALASLAHAQPVTTAFTFQGELRDGGVPVNGTYDLRFRLFNAAAPAGVQVGPTLCSDNVDVLTGKFTTILDFGQQYATGSQRHLEVDVRLETGLDCSNATGFTTLLPRQQLTATPLATQAQSAFSLDAPDGSPQNAVFVDNVGRVGVGTTTPTANLQVKTTAGDGIRIQGSSAGVDNSAYIAFANGAGTDIGYVGDGSSGDNSMYLGAYLANIGLITPAGQVMTVTSTGRVGIGTATPTSTLDVRGDVRLGTVGQFYALKSEAPDRTVRGLVNTVGTIGAGTGFTVSHTAGSGIYVINFNAAFSSAPTCVAASIAQARKVHVIQTQTTFATVGSTDVTNAFLDGGFQFIVMGN